jgi:hypothetical protein
MKIKKDYDVVSGSVPGAGSGTNFFDNPQIAPPGGSIPMTSGEKAKNDTSAESHSKSQPFKTKGSGYCD